MSGCTCFPNLSSYVPYTGANANVNIGNYQFTCGTLLSHAHIPATDATYDHGKGDYPAKRWLNGFYYGDVSARRFVSSGESTDGPQFSIQGDCTQTYDSNSGTTTVTSSGGFNYLNPITTYGLTVAGEGGILSFPGDGTGNVATFAGGNGGSSGMTLTADWWNFYGSVEFGTLGVCSTKFFNNGSYPTISFTSPNAGADAGGIFYDDDNDTLNLYASNIKIGSLAGYVKGTAGVLSAQATPIPVADGGTGAGALTLGSVVFAGASGVYSQDNTNFFWDSANKRLGVRVAAPAYPLDVSYGATSEYPLQLTSSSKYIRIGCLNSTYCHISTSATQGTYFYERLTAGGNNAQLGKSTENSYIAGTGGYFGVGYTTPAQRLHVGYGHMRFEPVPEASTPITFSLQNVAGNITAGVHHYYYVFVTAGGQTKLAAKSAAFTADASHAQNSLTVPVSTNPYVTKRIVYRDNHDVDYFYYPIITINDNTTTSVTDNIADPGYMSAGYLVPNLDNNTTAGKIYIGSSIAGFAGNSYTSFGLASAPNGGQFLTNFGTGNFNSMLASSTGTAFGSAIAQQITDGENYLFGFQTCVSATAHVSKVCAYGRYTGALLQSNGHSLFGYYTGDVLTTGGYCSFFGMYAGHTGTTATVSKSGGFGYNAQITVNNAIAIGGTGADQVHLALGTATPAISDGYGIHLAGKIIRLDTAKTPASAAAAGNAGEICWDANYIYVCIANATWRRAPHATW